MTIIIDMNLSPNWRSFLEKFGFCAIHWSDVGPGDAPDVEIMEYAKRYNAVILTHDLDFSSILAATKGQKTSVIQIRSQDLSTESIGGSVVQCLNQMSGELDAGALISLDAQKMRIRLLPFERG